MTAPLRACGPGAHFSALAIILGSSSDKSVCAIEGGGVRMLAGGAHPAVSRAATPVRTKTPAPMMPPMPIKVRSVAPRTRFMSLPDAEVSSWPTSDLGAKALRLNAAHVAPHVGMTGPRRWAGGHVLWGLASLHSGEGLLAHDVDSLGVDYVARHSPSWITFYSRVLIDEAITTACKAGHSPDKTLVVHTQASVQIRKDTPTRT